MSRTASAAKRGRNPKFPYVPVVKGFQLAAWMRPRTQQIPGKAFATREEAVAYAEAFIAKSDANSERFQAKQAEARANANVRRAAIAKAEGK